MSIMEYFQSPVSIRVGISLAHFLWQGFLIILLAQSVVILLAKRSAKSRYLIYMTSLLTMVLSLGLTYSIIDLPQSSTPFIGKDETLNLIKTGKEEKALRFLVKLIMTRGVLTMKKGTPAYTAARMMKQWNIGILPITDNGKPVGVVSERSLLKLFL